MSSKVYEALFQDIDRHMDGSPMYSSIWRSIS